MVQITGGHHFYKYKLKLRESINLKGESELDYLIKLFEKNQLKKFHNPKEKGFVAYQFDPKLPHENIEPIQSGVYDGMLAIKFIQYHINPSLPLWIQSPKEIIRYRDQKFSEFRWDIEFASWENHSYQITKSPNYAVKSSC